MPQTNRVFTGTQNPTDNQAPRSELRLDTANGFGSTNTVIGRFTTTTLSSGTAMTAADSATLGGSVTINEDGLYNITAIDALSGTGTIGISLNSNQLTTAIFGITAANRLASMSVSSGFSGTVGCTKRLTVNDVIRFHGDGTASSGIRTLIVEKVSN